MKKVLSHIQNHNLQSLLANGLGAVLGLVSFMLLTRQLGPEQFGHWVLFITLVTFSDSLRFGFVLPGTVRSLSSNPKNTSTILGASFTLHLYVLGAIAVVFTLINLLLFYKEIVLPYGVQLFVQWYPIVALFNLSNSAGLSLLQARYNYAAIFRVKLMHTGLFVVFLVGNYWFQLESLRVLLFVYVGCQALASLYSFVKRYDGAQYITKSTILYQKEIATFGKYAMGTLVSNNLLKSADIFIIGLSPVLGITAVAIFAIPLKLIELFAIPLNSFGMTAYPKMAALFAENNFGALRKLFYHYSGIVTLLFVIVAVLCAVIAPQLILILGGTQFTSHMHELVLLFRIFTIYIVVLPLDRFTGIMLDALNVPKLNFYKVLLMLLANVILDVIAVFLLKSIAAVAIGTIVFTLLGVVIGWVMANKQMSISFKELFKENLELVIKYKKTILA